MKHRSDFSTCATPAKIESPCIEHIRRNEILYVKSAEFQGSAQWKFSLDKTINADIQDEDFLSRVHSGEISISSKTYLTADVKVTIPLKPDGSPNESKVKYTIIKVLSVKTPDDKNQIKL